MPPKKKSKKPLMSDQKSRQCAACGELETVYGMCVCPACAKPASAIHKAEVVYHPGTKFTALDRCARCEGKLDAYFVPGYGNLLDAVLLVSKGIDHGVYCLACYYDEIAQLARLDAKHKHTDTQLHPIIQQMYKSRVSGTNS